jgi:exosortase E/protease (VPEID-CTERM system)
MLVPAALGAGAAGWLIARQGKEPVEQARAVSLPPWRPWRPLVIHFVAFGATAWLAHRLMGRGAPPISRAAFLGWGALAALTAASAVAVAAPLGRAARFASAHLRAPFLAVAVGVLAWRAAAAAEGLWGVFRTTTLRSVAALLLAARSDAVVLPAESVVGAGGFEVVIAPVCSGVDGLGLVLVFQCLWLALARSRIRFDRALVLLPLGAAAAFAVNVLRITVLVLLGASGRGELAYGAFHSKLGWLLFIGVALATVAAGEHVPWLRRTERRKAEGVPARTGAFLGPLMAALATALVTSLWASPAFDAWYGARVAAAALTLLAVRRELSPPVLSFSWVPVLLAAAVCAIWIPASGGDGAALRAELDGLARPALVAWIAARLLGGCLVLPVVEELAFRGFLLPWLVSKDFDAVSPRAWTWPAVALSSLAFGALHEQWLLGALAGVAFAVARANAGVAAAVLIWGRWDLWT